MKIDARGARDTQLPTLASIVPADWPRFKVRVQDNVKGGI